MWSARCRVDIFSLECATGLGILRYRLDNEGC